MIKTIPANEYHASAGLSASLSKIILAKSAYHAWRESPLNPNRVQDEAARMDIGTAAHAALLEGLDVVSVCHYDDWRKNEAKNARDYARSIGKVPLLTHQYEQVKAMIEVSKNALETCPDLNGLKWKDGKPEQSIFWQQDGVELRARIDWLANDKRITLDYKTTELSSPAAWMRAILSNGYDVQAAHYIDAVESKSGEKPEFVFLVQETTEPYLCYFVGLPPAYLEIGMQKCKIARARWKSCVERNEWPAYESRIMYAEPPAWAFSDIEEQIITQETWNELAFRFGKVAPKERSKK